MKVVTVRYYVPVTKLYKVYNTERDTNLKGISAKDCVEIGLSNKQPFGVSANLFVVC